MPPRASSADISQTPTEIAAAIEEFLAQHADARVLEDGRVLFDMLAAKYSVSTEHGRCSLQLWSDAANLVRRVVSYELRTGTLRLATLRFGQSQTKLMELAPARGVRTPNSRDGHRKRFLQLLERVLLRSFAEFKPKNFRTAMDLERSFGPAYARGSLVRGNRAWAVIAVNGEESAATIDGILTLGVLWLDDCRERFAGRQIYAGLRIIVPAGKAQATLARLRWMNHDAAQWELYELQEAHEELTLRDAEDQGNLVTRLLPRPDERAAAERFAEATAQVMQLVPPGEEHRVEQRLRSSTELAFLLHGWEFARARLGFTGNSFQQKVEITLGSGAGETALTPQNSEGLRELLRDLFARRSARATGRTRDVLYRSAPERWLESVLRADLAALTQHLGPRPVGDVAANARAAATDPDTLGNRADPAPGDAAQSRTSRDAEMASRIIPRLDPQHVYTQVSAVAGAGDRGVLDLLGITGDGRLAVIELKAEEDLHLALQGLDYWVRVRHHLHASQQGRQARASVDGEFQRHGYFTGLELSNEDPRLYLVVPALHIHPATERVLRYVSPRVEWHLLGLDERWRTRVQVVWRKDAGQLRV
jgi:hypothetical protein